MITFRVKTNLPDVIDYVNQMNNNIQSVIANAIEMSKEDILQDLQSVFGVPSEDVSIEMTFNGSNYTLTVEGINEYQLYNNTGYDLDFVLNYIENRMIDRIQSEIDEAGYGHGN